MGLKESGLRGSLRNVSVGIDAIPDSEVLDDWLDGNITSSRDDFDTTSYQYESESEDKFSIVGSRPEWVIENGSFDVSDNRLSWGSGDSIYVEFPDNLNLDEKRTWNFRNISHSGSGADYSYFGLYSETTNWFGTDTGGGTAFENSYVVRVRDDDTRIARVDDTDSEEATIAEGVSVSDGGDIRVERDADGTWELFVDGDSQDSGEDTTHTDPLQTFFAGRPGRSPSTDVDAIEVY